MRKARLFVAFALAFALAGAAGHTYARTLVKTTTIHPSGVPSGGVVNVTPNNLQGWTTQEVNCGDNPLTSSLTFVNGPDIPPIGTGSLQYSIGSNGDSFEGIRTTDFGGVPLADLTSLSYSTYVSQHVDVQAPYLNLFIDGNNDGVWDPDNQPSDDELYFEPVYQHGDFSGDTVPDQGPIVLDQWQTWDALDGGWWSNYHGPGGPPLITLQDYLDQYPDAVIFNPNSAGGLRIAAGCGAGSWDNFLGNADNLSVGVDDSTATYNFDPFTFTLGVGYTIVAHTGDSYYVGPNGVPTYGYAEADSDTATSQGVPTQVRYECDQYPDGIESGVRRYAYVDSFSDDVSINPTSNAGVTDSSDSPEPASDTSTNVYSFMKVTATDYTSGDTAYVRGGMRDDNPTNQITSGAYGITIVGTIYTDDGSGNTSSTFGAITCLAGGPPGPGSGGVSGYGGFGYAVDYYNPGGAFVPQT